MNKYYTPSIEEFRVGFSYELFDDFWMKDNKYHPRTFGVDSEGLHSARIDDILFNRPVLSKVRVKYLDRDDIESLGFIYHEKIGRGGPFLDMSDVYTIEYDYVKSNLYSSDDGLLYLRYNETTHKVETFNGRSYEDYSGATLTIKNKSELKVFLKQLRNG